MEKAKLLVNSILTILSLLGLIGESRGVTLVPKVFADGAIVRGSEDFFELDGYYYVPAAETCEALGATEAEEDGDIVTLRGDGIEISYMQGREYFTANGREFYWPEGVVTRGERDYVPAVFLAWAFGATMEYNEGTGCLSLRKLGEPILDGEEFYSEEDVQWLARIIEAEAGGESLAGKIAVGNVVLNRVESEEFPDAVYDVIFDNRYGVQFSPAYSGSVYNTPSADSVAAAKLALEGTEIVEGGLYFAAWYVADNCWAGRNMREIAEIGGHVFFG